MTLPEDYLSRVYSGVLGKLVGVYLGRPFEGWTHQRILSELGPIRYYVHEKLDQPLVVTDDDVAGTFIFVRALEEHENITSEAIGKTWLNNVIENRSIFWWGGNGISTEHTAYLNLKNGIPAPKSGSIEVNGKTVAEQIGAQIFIDGWAMVAPGNPTLAAQLAEAAGSVSHDGESVYAAKLLAAMEAEAFVSKDVNHLLDTGLKFIPSDSLLATVIKDVRQWYGEGDWLSTRQKIEDKYGYDKFCGECHVIPNHAIMTLALLYGGHDFHEAMYIINTCGWDTDCNSGNIGCLVAIMHGLKCFDGGPDWLGPLADRALISSADGGYSINNGSRIAYDLVNIGRRLAGEKPLPPPKDGAQFHFTLGSQGFPGKVDQDGLVIDSNGSTEILTQTFTPPEIFKMRTYDLSASPLVYPGQTVKACVKSDANMEIRIRLKAYGENDELVTFDGPSVAVKAGSDQVLEWTIPDNMDSQPIQSIGIAVEGTGKVWLKYLRWDGTPRLTLTRPSKQPCDFWRQAWVNGATTFHKKMQSPFYIAQDRGEGIVSYGTREWTDYRVKVHSFRVKFRCPAGIAVRVQGLRRYYAFLFSQDQQVTFVKSVDDKKVELARTSFDWSLDILYEVMVSIKGPAMVGYVNGHKVLEAKDDRYRDGGIGFIVTSGSISADRVEIREFER